MGYRDDVKVVAFLITLYFLLLFSFFGGGLIADSNPVVHQLSAACFGFLVLQH